MLKNQLILDFLSTKSSAFCLKPAKTGGSDFGSSSLVVNSLQLKDCHKISIWTSKFNAADKQCYRFGSNRFRNSNILDQDYVNSEPQQWAFITSDLSIKIHENLMYYSFKDHFEKKKTERKFATQPRLIVAVINVNSPIFGAPQGIFFPVVFRLERQRIYRGNFTAGHTHTLGFIGATPEVSTACFRLT